MLKKSVLMCIIVCFILPLQALAHSVLMDSTPADGEVIESPVEIIELRFDTKIEPISTLEIQSSEGAIVELSNVEVTNDTLIGHLDTPLPSGKYLVLWKIIGLDGHLVEGQISFESLYEPAASDNTSEEDNNTEEHTNTDDNNTDDNNTEENKDIQDPVESETTGESETSADEVGTSPAYTEQDHPFYSILFTLFVVIALVFIYRLWVKRRTS